MNKKARHKRKLERERIKAWHKYYENTIAKEVGKNRAYAELAQVHGAYITILLKRLGATEDNAVIIKGEEVKEALEKYEARAKGADGGFSLYYEVQGDGVQTEATTIAREEAYQQESIE